MPPQSPRQTDNNRNGSLSVERGKLKELGYIKYISGLTLRTKHIRRVVGCCEHKEQARRDVIFETNSWPFTHGPRKYLSLSQTRRKEKRKKKRNTLCTSPGTLLIFRQEAAEHSVAPACAWCSRRGNRASSKFLTTPPSYIPPTTLQYDASYISTIVTHLASGAFWELDHAHQGWAFCFLFQGSLFFSFFFLFIILHLFLFFFLEVGPPWVPTGMLPPRCFLRGPACHRWLYEPRTIMDMVYMNAARRNLYLP